jgi:hypothetical protein
MLVTIPEAFVCKSEQNIWIVEVWIAEELFDYLHPFLFPDFFKEKLTVDEFQVLFEIVKIFSSSTTRKEFNIQEFLDSYSSNMNGTRKNKIKECFIQYLKVLQKQRKLYPEVLFPSINHYYNEKSTYIINQLTSERLSLSETFVVFEIIDVSFS